MYHYVRQEASARESNVTVVSIVILFVAYSGKECESEKDVADESLLNPSDDIHAQSG